MGHPAWLQAALGALRGGNLAVRTLGTDSIVREKHHEDSAGGLSGLRGGFVRPAADAHASLVLMNDFMANPET